MRRKRNGNKSTGLAKKRKIMIVTVNEQNTDETWWDSGGYHLWGEFSDDNYNNGKDVITAPDKEVVKFVKKAKKLDGWNQPNGTCPFKFWRTSIKTGERKSLSVSDIIKERASGET